MTDKPAIITEMRERLSQTAGRMIASDIWAAAYVLMGLRFSQDLIRLLLSAVLTMRDSTTYQAILEEGRAEGRIVGRTEGRIEGRTEGALEEARRALLVVGSEHFGTPDARTLKVLQRITELERLEDGLRRVKRAKSWTDLLAIRRRKKT